MENCLINTEILLKLSSQFQENFCVYILHLRGQVCADLLFTEWRTDHYCRDFLVADLDCYGCTDFGEF